MNNIFIDGKQILLSCQKIQVFLNEQEVIANKMKQLFTQINLYYQSTNANGLQQNWNKLVPFFKSDENKNVYYLKFMKNMVDNYDKVSIKNKDNLEKLF